MTVTQLETIRSQLVTQLTDVTLDPKPTYSIDGQTVSWAQHTQLLQTSIDWCNAQSRGLQPAEIPTRAIT